MTPEAKVKKAIKAYLKDVPGCWFFMPIGGMYSIHGIPDIVGLVKGKFFAIECKAPGKANNTTANQERAMREIRMAGGIAFVAADLETVEAMFEQYGLINTLIEGDRYAAS